MALLAVGMALVHGPADAHKPSDSYLSIAVAADGAVTGRWDIALRDLDAPLALDADGDGRITWGEVRVRHDEIAAYATARLVLQADGRPCAATVGRQAIDEHSDGAYTVLPLRWQCGSGMPQALTVDYRLFADTDPQHRGLVKLAIGGAGDTGGAGGAGSPGGTGNPGNAGGPAGAGTPARAGGSVGAGSASDAGTPMGAASPTGDASPGATGEPGAAGAPAAGTRAAVLGPHAPQQRFELAGVASGSGSPLVDYLREGVRHIAIGYDHILFLLALLLPAVGRRAAHSARWQPEDRFAPAFWDVLRIVTAFTVAHSITLSLAVLGVLDLPSRLVESTIAASVALAALNNVFPAFHRRRWMVAFGFGLVHGFGFASVLADLGLPAGALALALLGFNVGVECGQLAIVAVFLPLAWAARRTVFYRRAVLVGGSLAIAALAAAWFAERAFGLELLPA